MSTTDRPRPARRPELDRRGRVYTPAVGPGLRPVLWTVLLGFAVLGATGIYLGSVTLLTWLKGASQQTYFYMMMVAAHLFLGFLIIVPFIAFGGVHLLTSFRRPNRSAVRNGLLLLTTAIILLASGLVLVRIGGFEVRDPRIRDVGYWLHVGTPILAIVFYIRHRLAGPMIRWKHARFWGAVTAVVTVVMGVLHTIDPRAAGREGPTEGAQYFFPSQVKTADGNLIPASTLMMDDYCLKCHKDAYQGWFHSSHHFSSFNNPAYLASVRETRKVGLERDGDVRASRWCAGCHDVVPFLSGEFQDPKYDDVNNPTAHAGITCTVCHSITHVNSTRGNADFTIEEPQHYPFAQSRNAILQWVNNTLVKAKPDLHKRTFLKPLHKDEDFCSTCHKVSLPFELNKYKDFLRGQNHHDTYLLSGVSGHGARSFYYPEVAKSNCAECHMGYQPSHDFGARDFDGKPGREIHDHFFPAANTGLATLLNKPEVAERHAAYLKDKKTRLDIFALREGGTIEGELIPLRPTVPTLEPGQPYLVEVVVRTLALGHPLTQGTADSNEIWVELIARSGGKVIGRSGGIDETGRVDPYSHFLNIYMLDRDGKRIDRRNPQDIFVPLYNRQIPPGAAQVAHFALDVPEALDAPIELEARLNYRKFDKAYMDYVARELKREIPELPVVLMAADSLALPVAGGPAVEPKPSPIEPEWQRWNDYGIALLLEGGELGAQKGELKQAEPVFRKVAEEFGVGDGWVNLARVYEKEGRIPEALDALKHAAADPDFKAKWTINWLTGRINRRNGHIEDAIGNFEAVLATRVPDRKFDFSLDYEVINELGQMYDRRGRIQPPGSPERVADMERAAATYGRTFALDRENVAAHYALGQIYADLARGSEPLPDELVAQAEGSGTAETLLAIARRIAESGAATPPERAAAARELTAGLEEFLGEEDRPRFVTKLDPLIDLVEILTPAWQSETDQTARSELARALEVTHKGIHAMVKPDESAEGRAIRIAREDNPAANQYAQAVVIHDMNRPGAPGIDRPPAAAASAAPNPAPAAPGQEPSE